MMSELLTLAIAADQESGKVEFKETLLWMQDQRLRGWKSSKDIVAMANSGGGALLIGIKDRVSVPLIFTTSGNYQEVGGKPKSAFTVGVVYFRHGTKSEPATSDDLQQFINQWC